MTIKWWFAICALIEIWWMTLKIIGTYTTSSLVHHFKSIPKWPIWVKFDDLFLPCDLETWWLTLKNNRAPFISDISLGILQVVLRFDIPVYHFIYVLYHLLFRIYSFIFLFLYYIYIYTYLFTIHLISSVNVYFILLNSLWPGNTIWWHGTGSTLAYVWLDAVRKKAISWANVPDREWVSD